MTGSAALPAARRAAVAGSPISHSLSPVLHRAAYAALGLDWTYAAIECDEAGLPSLLGGLDASWAGLSLTMPLKRAALPLLDVVTPLAEAVAAANTVIVGAGGLTGDNTDVPGMVNALREAAPGRAFRSALVLGGGATATSALAALQQLRVGDVSVAVRSSARAGELVVAAERLGAQPRLVGWDEPVGADLIVSTVPPGAADAVAARLFAGSAPSVVFDVVYRPWPTRLAEVASVAGSIVVGGLDLLLHQAALQVELMTGRAAPIDAMRAALSRE